MKAERNFDIHIFKLSNGTHDYQFEIQDSFFELFENEIVNQGNLEVNISLNKSDRMIQADIEIDGEVTLTCDRSLEEFQQPIHTQRQMLFKYGEEDKELSEDVMVIAKDTQTINLASLIFEFITLEIPMKKLHPKFQEEEDEDDEYELTVVYTSEEEEEPDDTQTEEPIDPRWEKLKNLKK
ncbi:YceD family protein [Roseivirga pacifica]|uniref:YceD family protein n=1 Tax=Roseivirga pacifica TaxID=1267423 RepID=UPI00227CFAA6